MHYSSKLLSNKCGCMVNGVNVRYGSFMRTLLILTIAHPIFLSKLIRGHGHVIDTCAVYVHHIPHGTLHGCYKIYNHVHRIWHISDLRGLPLYGSCWRQEEEGIATSHHSKEDEHFPIKGEYSNENCCRHIISTLCHEKEHVTCTHVAVYMDMHLCSCVN